MSCVCPEGFLRSHNPRRADCVRCGLVEGPDPLPPEVVDPFFDRLREALEGGGYLRVPGPGDPPDPTFDWYRDSCHHRLRKGARVYGARNFLRPGVDPITELLEELQDAANYVLMELVKNETGDEAPLWEVASRVFTAVQFALHYKAKRRGVSG